MTRSVVASGGLHDRHRARRVLCRYNTCCNKHRFDDLGEFVAPDVVINGGGSGPDVYADDLRAVVAGFADFRWQLRHLVVEAPWIDAHLADTGTHHGTYFGVPATGRRVATDEFAMYLQLLDRLR